MSWEWTSRVQPVLSGTGSFSCLRLRPDSASVCERFRRGCRRCRRFHATLTRHPASRQLQFHAAFTEKVGSCAQLGFSLANVARSSSPASEPFGHKRLYLPLKRNGAQHWSGLGVSMSADGLFQQNDMHVWVFAGVTPVKGGERP